ncbi:hypothetical protein ACFL0Q_09305, partial [Thermodesulfobacteriota bacterium]
FYFSTQERFLFERLLTSGILPDIAVFIDGLNEFIYHDDEPFLTRNLQDFLLAGQTTVSMEWTYISRIPLVRFAKEVRRKLRKLHLRSKDRPSSGATRTQDLFPKRYDDRRLIESVIDRYLRNKRMIEVVSTVYGVIPVFVWQPVPTYGYDDVHNYGFAKGGFGRHTSSKFGYELMASRIETDVLGNEFLWCADIQKGIEGPLYVDQFHYSPILSKLLAERIGDMIVERELFPSPSKSNDKPGLGTLKKPKKPDAGNGLWSRLIRKRPMIVSYD